MIQKIDFNTWIYQFGMPPVAVHLTTGEDNMNPQNATKAAPAEDGENRKGDGAAAEGADLNQHGQVAESWGQAASAEE